MTSRASFLQTNRSTLFRSFLTAVVGLSVVSFPDQMQAQYVWTSANSGTYNFGDGVNWSGGTPPPASTSDGVSFASGNAAITLNFNIDREVLGGFNFQRRNSGTFNLGTSGTPRTLTVGGDFNLGGINASATYATFANGTLQMGTASVAGSLNVFKGTSGAGSASTPSKVIFNTGSTFDSFNLQTLTVASMGGGNVTPSYGVLDLSLASMKSGTNANALVVTGDVLLGNYTGSGSGSNLRGGEGSLLLGAATQKVQFGNLVIGENLRNSAAASKSFAGGNLNLGGGSNSNNFHITENLLLGRGDNVNASITNASSNLNFSVGSDNDRGGSVWIGYKDRTQGTASDGADNAAVGSFVSNGGTFNAYVTELRVGQNTRTAGSATGTLDFSLATLGTLDVSGDVYVGVSGGGTGTATGTLKLKNGEATATNLYVGTGTGADGNLFLDQTLFTLSDMVQVGSGGAVNITVGSGPAGFDLTSTTPAALSIALGGLIDINFSSAAGESDIWGLRLVGDQISLLEGYIADGSLVASGDYASFASVYTVGGYTYYGMAAIPEPGSTMLMIVGALGLGFAVRRRMSR